MPLPDRLTIPACIGCGAMREDQTCPVPGAELADLLAGAGPGPERVVTDAARNTELGQVLDRLPPSQAKVIRLRYGLDGAEPVTLTGAASVLGVSRERVRQLEARALARLRYVPELASLA